MARLSQKKRPKLFYATMHITRVEHWCVEADDLKEAEALLRSGEGHRHDVGDCIHREVSHVEPD
jgi:hypothetical protein